MLLVIGGVSILAAALMNVAEPLLATGPLHAGSSGYSVLVAVYGAAMTAASVATSRAGSNVRRLRRWLMAGLIAEGAGMIGSAAAPGLGFAAVSFALAGAGNALFSSPELRLLQELTGTRVLGRVFGLRDTVCNLAYVLAFVSSGALLAVLGVRAMFAVGGAGLLALALAPGSASVPAAPGRRCRCWSSPPEPRPTTKRPASRAATRGGPLHWLFLFGRSVTAPIGTASVPTSGSL